MRVNRIDTEGFTYNVSTHELRYKLHCNNPNSSITNEELRKLICQKVATINEAVMTALLNKKILTLVRNHESIRGEEVWITYINFKNHNLDTCSIR